MTSRRNGDNGDNVVKLRVWGSQATCEDFLKLLSQFGQVSNVRGPYPVRGDRGTFRVYTTVTKHPSPEEPAP